MLVRWWTVVVTSAHYGQMGATRYSSVVQVCISIAQVLYLTRFQV